MAGQLYLGEQGGARILKIGVGIAQVGDPYEFDVTTWDLLPGGEVGDCGFRSIDVTLLVSNGYAVIVTPIIDGVALEDQQFSGAGAGERQVQAFIAARGSRIAARVRTNGRTGTVELHTISTSFVVIRRSP